MEDDALWRAVALTALGLCAVAYALGGFFCQVAGLWRDGDTLVQLRQIGPFVWGDNEVPGGQQRYRGRALYGRLRLWRQDYGEAHLRGLGFDEATWRHVLGRVTGHLQLRLHGGGPAQRLEGSFVGRRFSFDGGRLRDVARVAPAPRLWRRDESPPGR